jgi:hypothetical protein
LGGAVRSPRFPVGVRSGAVPSDPPSITRRTQRGPPGGFHAPRDHPLWPLLGRSRVRAAQRAGGQRLASLVVLDHPPDRCGQGPIRTEPGLASRSSDPSKSSRVEAHRQGQLRSPRGQSVWPGSVPASALCPTRQRSTVRTVRKPCRERRACAASAAIASTVRLHRVRQPCP